MKIPTVTKFVRSLPRELLRGAFNRVPPPDVIDLRVEAPPRPARGFGIYFHEMFDAANAGEWVARDVYPYVYALRRELEQLGVTATYTEWRHVTPLRATVDASLVGGPRRWGVLETKVVLHVPRQGYADDFAQLAAYCQLAALHDRPLRDVWAVLAYVLPEQSRIRLLVWHDAEPLVRELSRLLRNPWLQNGAAFAETLELAA